MINFLPGSPSDLKPRITVVGVGGAGGNAVNNMIRSELQGVEFIVANTDAQALSLSRTERRIQLGAVVTQGLGAGSKPEVGRNAAEESLEDLHAMLAGSNMVFITAGMGGGTGTGAAPVIAQTAKKLGLLTVGVVTKPFHFEGAHRMRTAEAGIEEMSQYVDTLLVIPNQNLFRIATERTTFADAFKMADDVLHSGVRGVTDLMIMPGLINLDFADIRTVMAEMGKAMMGTGEAEGDKRAIEAAEAAISNPLLDDTSMKGAKGVLISITGGLDMTLFEVDEAANRIRSEVDSDANIIFGSTFDEKLTGRVRVSVVATGIGGEQAQRAQPPVSVEIPQPANQAIPAAPARPSQMVHPVVRPQAQFAPPPAPAQRIPPAPANPEADYDDHHRVEPSLSRPQPARHPQDHDMGDIARTLTQIAERAPLPQAQEQPQYAPPAPQASPGFVGAMRNMMGAGPAKARPAAPPRAHAPREDAGQGQLRLNTVDTRRETAGQNEMDIPAFLRRQAN